MSYQHAKTNNKQIKQSKARYIYLETALDIKSNQHNTYICKTPPNTEDIFIHQFLYQLLINIYCWIDIVHQVSKFEVILVST